jgi:uncharacterized protein (DUF1778 family)
MRIVSVRFGEDQIDLIHQMAEASGVSASQFIRDGAYARAATLAVQRKEHQARMWITMLALAESCGADAVATSVREVLREQPRG